MSRACALAALCCCALLAVAKSSSDNGITQALQRVLPRPDALKALASMHRDLGAQRSGSRALLAAANASLCTYSSLTGCDLNADFISSLGTPDTDSQKLLAYTSVLSYNCSKLTTKASCTGTCQWIQTSSTTGMCTISDTFFNLSWLRGKAYCAGSNMDTAITCGQITTQSSCGGSCTWQSTSASASGTAALASSFTELFSGFGGSSAAVNVTGTCYPGWINDQNFVASLAQKIANAVSSAGASFSSNGAASILGPIFDDLFGTCSGVSAFKNMLLTCPQYNTSATCNAASGCSWTGSSTFGSCDMGEGTFGIDLLLDPTDDWVKKFNNATATCDSKTSSLSCSAAGAISVDTAVYTSSSYVAAAQPSYLNGGGGAAGMAGVSSLVSLMAGGLFALFFLL